MSYVSSYFHCVFSTKQRRPLIAPELRDRLWPFMGGIARQNDMKAIDVGGMPDHVHILLSLPATLSIAKALQLIKGGSSKWVHETFPKHRLFGWQVKYGAFSVSASQLDKIVAHAFQRAGSGGFPAARWWYFQGAPGPWRAHLDTTTKSTGTDRGCVRSTSRSGTARPGVFGQLSDSGHPHLLRLVLRTQPRSGGGSKKMRPPRRVASESSCLQCAAV